MLMLMFVLPSASHLFQFHFFFRSDHHILIRGILFFFKNTKKKKKYLNRNKFLDVIKHGHDGGEEMLFK